MDTTTLILSAAAIVGGLITLVTAVYSVYKIARRIDDAIGVDSKGRTISERLDRVEHQLWENGGSSLADRVNHIGAASTVATAELTLIKEFLLAGSIHSSEPVAPVRQRATRKKTS